MRHLASFLFLAAAGCSAKMAVFGDPLGEHTQPQAQLAAPSLKLELQGIDLSSMGLYLAPNILPALQPPLVAPQALAIPMRPAPTIPAWLIEEAEAGNVAAIAAIERSKEKP